MMRSASQLRSTTVLALMALFAPAAAHAAGLYIPDTGTTARARGGAYVADADDPLAIVYNPAGLADQHQRNQILVDITALQFSMKFDRKASDIPADGSAAGTSATNNPPVQIVPDILYVHNFSDNLSVGGGLHAPTGARYHFKASGPQRYSVNDLFLTEAGAGVSVGYRPIKFVAVGLTLETLITGVDQKFDLSLGGPLTTPNTEAPANDVPGELKVMETMNPTAILGVKVYPMDAVEIGLSYRPQVRLNMPGTLDTDKTPLSPAHSEKVHFHSDLASIARLGVRYVQPTWDGEVDFVMEDWSNHKEDSITADDGNFFGSNEAALPRHWKSAFSVRAGGSYKVAEKVRALAGLYYESSSVPTEYMDVGSFDAPKEGVNVGAKYDINPTLTLGGNLSYTMLSAVTVNDSAQKQQSPYPPNVVAPSNLTTIANGKYSGAYEFFGISLLTKF